MVESPSRGDVYWTDLDPVTGSEMGRTRPALVVQNDGGNRASATTIVAAISSRYRARDYPFLVELPADALPRPSIVNCAQVRTVDKARLHTGRLATLDAATMARVDEALRASLGLKR
jgi:mRNA interferase MazF